MKWVTLSSNSLVITPLDTNLVSAIIGLYFGGSLVKKNEFKGIMTASVSQYKKKHKFIITTNRKKWQE